MLLSLTFNAFALINALNIAVTKYRDALTNVNIEVVYGTSGKTQAGGWYILTSPMSGSYDQANLGCQRSQSKLFSVYENFNLTEIFAVHELESTWTMIYPDNSNKTFLDDSEFVPLTYTMHEMINGNLLKTRLVSDSQRIILQKIGQEFHYIPVEESAEYRAICLQKIAFPRSSSSMSVLVRILQEFLQQTSDIEKELSQSMLNVKNVLAVLPYMNTSFETRNTKSVQLDDIISQKISKITQKAVKIAGKFSQISAQEDVTELMLLHISLIKYIENIEKDILEPFERPLSLVNTNWNEELLAESTVEFFTSSAEKLYLRIVPTKYQTPVSDSTFSQKPTETIHDSVTTKVPILSPTRPTILEDSKGFNQAPSDENFGLSFEVQDVVDGFFGAFKPPSTTTPSPERTKTFQDWFVEQIQTMVTVTTYLHNSWRFPSVYDISLSIGFFAHTIILIIMAVKFQRKPPPIKKPVVRKIGWPKFMKRKKSLSKTKTRNAKNQTVKRSSNLSIEMEEILPSAPMSIDKKKASIKKVHMYEYSSDDETVSLEMHNTTMRPTKSSKKAANSTQSKSRQAVYRQGEGVIPKSALRKKAYLPGDIPIYLLESETSLI